MRRRSMAGSGVIATAVLVAGCGGGPTGEGGDITNDNITLGVITDLSAVYSDVAGQGAVEGVEMAVEDFLEEYGEDAVTQDISVVSADHQNAPDVANNAAREMYDRQGVDAIFGVPNSAAALAVATVAEQAQQPYFNIGGATTELTGAQCNPYTFGWAYSTYMLAQGTGRTLTEQGAENWYIIYPDYVFGQDMQSAFTSAIEDVGGNVIAADPTPFPNDNFATFLLQAPTLDPVPDILGVMQAGGDLVNVVNQYNEFGLREQGIDLAVGLMFDSDIEAIGPEQLEGTLYTTAWFWNLDDRSREWADRFLERTGDRPTFIHAANYSAAMQYLQAAQRIGTDDGDAIVTELEGHEFDDFFARNSRIRAEDHRNVHDAYLTRVRVPGPGEEAADFTELVETIPGDTAFRPVEESGCQMG